MRCYLHLWWYFTIMCWMATNTYFLHARYTSSGIRFVSLFTPAQYPHCGRGSEILLNRISNLSHDISSCLIYLSISEKDWGAASVCETAGNKVSSDWMGRICWIGRGIIVSALRVSLYGARYTNNGTHIIVGLLSTLLCNISLLSALWNCRFRGAPRI